MSRIELVRVPLFVALLVFASGCSDDRKAETPAKGPDAKATAALLTVAETEAWQLPGLHGEAHVVRTEGSVPHIYAADRHDLALIQGFIVARDRFFFMDMGRRLGQGKVAELLGDAGLEQDYEARLYGMSSVAKNIVAVATEEQLMVMDAFAAGINAYIAEAKAGKLPLPSEVEIAAPMLGFGSEPTAMMEPFSREDVAGFAAVLIYQLGYETGDVGRGQTAAKLSSWFEGAALQDLRRKGAIADIWNDIRPPAVIASAHGWGLETAAGPPAPPPPPAEARKRDLTRRLHVAAGPHVPAGMLDDLIARQQRFERRRGHDHDLGFGSNSWAVAGSATTDGASLLAGDGHLSLTIPSYFYQLGLDTSVLGGGDVHQAGLAIPGLPIMAVGTNGDVAWCQTQLFGDITDWYVEEIKLDAAGAPATSLFKGVWRDTVAHAETFISAKVDALLPDLKSAGGTHVWHRYETFDGRRIMQIEGKAAKADTVVAKGETLVNLGGKFVIPGDTDGDGKVTAISADYTGWDEANMLLAVDRFGHARDVAGFRQATRGLVAYSQNLVAADGKGDVLYTGYQAVPCRGYLDRNADGTWADGADPSQLLDGTRYGAFTIPIKDGVVDEGPGQSDPYKCVVPFDKYPQSRSPKQGFVLTANNDIGGFTFDNSLTNEPWYVGGPWLAGYRAARIGELLEGLAKDKKADVVAMVDLQADVRSPLGARYVPDLLAALKSAADKAANDADLSVDDQRLVDLFEAVTPAVMNEVRERLAGWQAAGFVAVSGVATFYNTPDEAQRKSAVATLLFNAWMGRFQNMVFNDEPMGGVWRFSGSTGRARSLSRFVAGRGKDNPENLASFNPDTGESAFFDILGTDVVERCDELMIQALIDTLDFLRGPKGKEAGTGGFASEDMSGWLWGLRHMVKFESTIGDFFDDGGNLKALTDQFAITTKTWPLTKKFEPDDPRIPLKWFPRGGDAFAVDAAGGVGTDRWHYGSGPVFRMAIALKDGKVEGVNVIPGGQSARKDSKFFADQARLWLENKTWPLRFHVDQVVAGATGRERYTPK